MIQKISLDEDPKQLNNQTEPDTTMSSLESMPTKSNNKTKNIRLYSVSIAVIVGLVTGFFISQNNLKQSGVPVVGEQLQQNPTDAASVKVGDVFGSSDAESFSDSAIGIIQPGGIEGEGTHHLERGTDKSQWVYLTSSVIDLDLFLTTEVELWGETFQGKKAGWLMDVGRLKVSKLNAAEVNNIE